jgi:hypothetical protein
MSSGVVRQRRHLHKEERCRETYAQSLAAGIAFARQGYLTGSPACRPWLRGPGTVGCKALERRDVKMYRRILISLVAIGVLTSFMGLGGLSLFTATTDNDDNAFSSGSVYISTDPDSAFLTMDNMAPGDSVIAQLTVSNTVSIAGTPVPGTLELRYDMTTVADNDDTLNLRDALMLTIKTLNGNCTAFNGTQLYTGTLANGAMSDRTLAAGASEVLCFKVELPSIATGPKDASTTATFTFAAEQTKNNP